MDTKINGKFYPLTPETAKKLRNAKLTAAEWRLWSYLVELDPFGDRYQDLPDTLTIMQEVDIKKTTFYTAIAKFQKLELFDFQDKGFAFRTLTRFPKNRKAVREIGKLSENSENFPKNRKAVREIGKLSENSENQSPKPAQGKAYSFSQTIQTYTDFKNTLSDSESSDSEREKFLSVIESLPHDEREKFLSAIKSVSDSQRKKISIHSTKSLSDISEEEREKFLSVTQSVSDSQRKKSLSVTQSLSDGEREKSLSVTKPVKKPAPQTYCQFIKGLSTEEREKFFNFVRQKTKNFNPALVCLDDYLASKGRWQGLYKEFRAVVYRTTESHTKPKRQGRLAAKIDRMREQALKAQEQEEANKKEANNGIFPPDR